MSKCSNQIYFLNHATTLNYNVYSFSVKINIRLGITLTIEYLHVLSIEYFQDPLN